MTILSKKKTLQGKQEETTDNQAHHGAQPINPLPSHSQNERSRDDRLGSPQCWPNSLDDMRSPHHNYEDFDPLESGPSHGKRRLKASPLRGRSTKLRTSVPSGSPSHSSGSPIAGPSGDSSSSGYNSGDEYDDSKRSNLTEAQWQEKDRIFEKRMRKKGFIVNKMPGDGACLFRGVADQLYGDQEKHALVRQQCMDHIKANADYFSQYVTEDFNKYVSRKRLECTHGNHIEMQAISEIYNRPIELYCYGRDPKIIFHGRFIKTDNAPIRLSYHRESHYNSVVDPLKSPIGVGLGLPTFNPTTVDANILEAIRQSEDSEIEQTMLEDKRRATDWEATNEAIEEHCLRQSYYHWLKECEKREKAKSSGASSTSTMSSDGCGQSSARSRSPSPHPSNADERNHLADSSYYNYGRKWEEARLEQVLAQSAQEYFDFLKKNRSPAPETSGASSSPRASTSSCTFPDEATDVRNDLPSTSS